MDAQGPTRWAVTDEPFLLTRRISAYMAESQWRRVAEALDLTGRKLEVARVLFGGLDEPASAEWLGVSRHTVHTHVRAVYRLLNVQGRHELFRRIVATHLVINLGDVGVDHGTEKTIS